MYQLYAASTFRWSVGHGINLLSSEKDWACLSVLVIEPYFAVLKPFPYFVLNVFCGFQLLIHLQTTNWITARALRWCRQSSHVSSSICMMLVQTLAETYEITNSYEALQNFLRL